MKSILICALLLAKFSICFCNELREGMLYYSSDVVCSDDGVVNPDGTVDCKDDFVIIEPEERGVIEVPNYSCLREKYNRGFGSFQDQICKPGEERYGFLCYPKCKDGYEPFGCCVCRKKGCGDDDRFKETFDGSSCIKPAPYGRGVGYPWKFGDQSNSLKEAFERCEKDNGENNCEKWGKIVYPKCKQGYYAFGCCICTPQCPNGYIDIGAFCFKKIYSRGIGSSHFNCTKNREYSFGMCYENCKRGYNGVGSVCWKQCPASMPFNCGLFCSPDKAACRATAMTVLSATATLAGGVIAGGIGIAAATSFAAVTGNIGEVVATVERTYMILSSKINFKSNCPNN